MPEDYEIPFLSKSEDEFENGLEQIYALTKYRDELDKIQIATPCQHQVLKAALFHESKIMTKAIKEFYKVKGETNI